MTLKEMLLTDEEILAIQNEYTEESRSIWGGVLARDEKTELAFALASIPDRIAKAQLKKVGEELRMGWSEVESDSSSMRDFMEGFIGVLLEEI